MKTGDVCTRDVVFVDRETNIHYAAQVMRERHVGDLIVIDSAVDPRKPVGIVTDRDIVISVVAPQIDPRVFTVGDVMGLDLLAVPEDQEVFETVRQMRIRGVRRVPVTNKDGDLVGVFTVDDYITLMAREFNDLPKLITRERVREAAMKV